MAGHYGPILYIAVVVMVSVKEAACINCLSSKTALVNRSDTFHYFPNLKCVDLGILHAQPILQAGSCTRACQDTDCMLISFDEVCIICGLDQTFQSGQSFANFSKEIFMTDLDTFVRQGGPLHPIHQGMYSLKLVNIYIWCIIIYRHIFFLKKEFGCSLLGMNGYKNVWL